jgi:WS/DGAT/MGAT family acyltransferase
MPLDQIKRIARVSGTTINDVVVSAIAGAIGVHLREAGTDTHGLRIRAMVPVNLRPPEDEAMHGNQFSLVYLELPVGIVEPYERLMRVKIEMDRIKSSLEPWAGWVLVQGLGFLPARVEHVASGFYADKATLVLTNVIGPRKPLYMAGSKIEQMSFWEPEAGKLGVGVSIYSYGGNVIVGFVSDRGRLARPQRVADEVMRAMTDLARVASQVA